MQGDIRTLAPLGLAAVVVAVGLNGGWSSVLAIERPAGVGLSILLVAAILWIAETIPLFVTSFVVLLLNIVWMVPVLAAHGVEASAARFMAPFFSDIILLFLGGFVLSAAFRRFGIDERIAQAVLQRTGPRPAHVLAGVMGTTAVLSMWMSNTATTAMMLGLAGPLLARVSTAEPFRTALLLGIPFAANLGGLGTPIGTPPNAVAVQYLQDIDAGISFGAWIVMAAPMLLALLLVAWGLLIRVHRTRLVELDLPPPSSEPIPRRGWFVVGVTAVTVIGWLTSPWHGLTSGTVALVPVVALFGAQILRQDDFRQLPWDVLVLTGGGLSLGVSVGVSGLAEYVVQQVPVDDAPSLVVGAGFAVIASLMSTFMSNTATANLLIPVVAGLPAELQTSIVCVVAFSCSVSMALPITTPPNAMAFGSGCLQVKDMVAIGTALTVLGVVGALLSTFWWSAIGAI